MSGGFCEVVDSGEAERADGEVAERGHSAPSAPPARVGHPGEVPAQVGDLSKIELAQLREGIGDGRG